MLTGLNLCWLRLAGMSVEVAVACADFGSDRVALLIDGGFRAMTHRPPTAFALFLKSHKGKWKTIKRVRYTTKTTVFRFDLLKLKFASLVQADREVYIDASARAAEEFARVRSSAANASQSDHAVGTVITCNATALATAGADALSSAISRCEYTTGHAVGTHITCHNTALAIAGPDAVSSGNAGVGSQSIPIRTASPATAGAVAMPHDQSPSWSVHAADGSPARTCVAAASAPVTFTDLASGVQTVFQLVSGGQLGKGGWGSCCLLEDVATGNRLCGKFDADADSEGGADRDHLRRELLAMSRLCHPNVLKAYGLCYGPGDRVECLLLPLCNGNLRSWTQSRPADALASTTVAGPMRWEERGSLIQVANGLAHIHARHIVHMDLKPENVLVQGGSSAQTFLIADFGICRSNTRDGGIIHGGRVPPDEVNTLEYRPIYLCGASSEVKIHTTMDVWALGCIMFEVAAWPNPQWRGTRSHMLRFFTDVRMNVSASAWSARDHRLKTYCPRVLQLLVLQATSAPKPSTSSVTAAGLVTSLCRLPTVSVAAAIVADR